MKMTGNAIPGWADAGAEPAWPSNESEISVGRRFDQVVAADSEAVALRSPAGDTLSYGELNADSSRLAHLIEEHVEGSERPIGILARHPTSAITAMLAALKVGCMYVPLDPSDPPSRLQHIMNDANAQLIVTPTEHISAARRLAGQEGAVVVIGRDDAGMPEIYSSDGTVDDLAYLLYTSGSTGAPKGVLHSHRNLLHKAEVARTVFGVGRGDRLSLLFGPATGAATSGIFGSLLNGATVCPYDLKMHGLRHLGQWLNSREVTVLHIVPTVFRRFLGLVDEKETYPSVRLLILPGEPTFRRDVELFRRHFGSKAVLAPRLSSAETSVVAVDYVDHESHVEDDVLTVGFPLDDKEVRLVDETGQAVAAGSTGQIEVEGDYLALGYWRNPELTESKFGVSARGRRTYRMGDLARFREDGRLEFLGRIDDRLKINGVTIEPREVERAMQRVGRFKELAVVGRTSPHGEERLVAYAVLEDDEQLPPDLRSSLAELLPAAMIPTTTVVVDSLPLTSLGKIDKRALPEPELGREQTVPPRDELESTLVDIWSEVLAIPDIGVTDDFFELGGTSIQALQTFALIGKRLGFDVPSTTLLQAPTIAALGDVIRTGAWEATQDSLIPVSPGGNATPFFCVHGGGGGIFFVRDLAAHLRGNRPIFGLQARGFEGHPGPYRPVEELAANYVEEVRTVQGRGPYLLGGLSFGGKVAFEMAQQLMASGQEVALVALLDTQAIPSVRDSDPGRHRARMRSMAPTEKAAYVMRGVGKRLARSLKRLLIRYYLVKDRPLPDTLGLRNLYFYPMHARANRAYVPGPYGGRVAVIAAQNRTQIHTDTWGRVSEGGFSVVEIATSHAGLVDMPHIEEVARHLQHLLDEADPEMIPREVPM
jgi:amino acid adenylation domain-containing protein